MKYSRYKRAKNILAFFSNTYEVCPPYDVMVDATFCAAALKGRVNIKEQIPNYFQAETDFFTTQCIVLEAERLGSISKEIFAAYLIAKEFRIQECGHEGNPIPASHCMKSLIKRNNPNKYIVATDDRILRDFFSRKIVSTPVVYFSGSSPTLCEVSEKNADIGVRKVSLLSSYEEDTLSNLRKQFSIVKKRDPKAMRPDRIVKTEFSPNPLSCKKSNKQKHMPEIKEGERKRKRHKRNKQTYSSVQ